MKTNTAQAADRFEKVVELRAAIEQVIRVDHPFIRNFFLSERSSRALQNTQPR